MIHSVRLSRHEYISQSIDEINTIKKRVCNGLYFDINVSLYYWNCLSLLAENVLSTLMTAEISELKALVTNQGNKIRDQGNTIRDLMTSTNFLLESKVNMDKILRRKLIYGAREKLEKELSPPNGDFFQIPRDLINLPTSVVSVLVKGTKEGNRIAHHIGADTEFIADAFHSARTQKKSTRYCFQSLLVFL